MVIDSDLCAAPPRQQIDSVRFEEGISQRRGAATARPGVSFAAVAAQVEQEQSAAAGQSEKPRPASGEKKFSLWENADFSFGDLVDIINPLQHLPIVATIYRNMTGDRIGALPRVVGGAIWGRIGGFISGAVNALVEWFTGKDIGDHVYAYFHDLFSTPPAGAIASSEAKPGEASLKFPQTAKSTTSAPAVRVDDRANPAPVAPLRRSSAEVLPAIESRWSRASATANWIALSRVLTHVSEGDRQHVPTPSPKLRLTA